MSHICVSQCRLAVCKGTYLIKCHFLLSVECSPVSHPMVWKVFVRNTEQLELNCLGLCIYSLERQTLFHWKSLNLIWHLPVLTLLILVFTPGSSVCFLWLDEAELLLLFLPFYLLAQEQQTSPCRRNMIWCESRHFISLGVWTFYLANSETFFPFLGEGCCGHRLPFWLGSVPVLGPPFPGGFEFSCSIQLHLCFQR